MAPDRTRDRLLAAACALAAAGLGLSYLLGTRRHVVVAVLYLGGALLIAVAAFVGRRTRSTLLAVFGVQYLLLGLAGILFWHQPARGAVAAAMGAVALVAILLKPPVRTAP